MYHVKVKEEAALEGVDEIRDERKDIACLKKGIVLCVIAFHTCLDSISSNLSQETTGGISFSFEKTPQFDKQTTEWNTLISKDFDTTF